jgi:hypothetical protein
MQSCDKESTAPSSNNDNGYITVSFDFTGEAPNITTTPMSRANEAKDWYQIQVYSCPIGESYYTYYGYGFFDNTENMIINLKEGYQYKFVADMIVDASEKIYKFSLSNSGWASIGNSFYFSTDEHIRFLGEGYIYMNKPWDTYNRPDVDRFYGITEGYVPEDGGSVSIDMKRVSFGVKFVAKEFTSGSLEIQIDQSPTKTLKCADGNVAECIVSFKNTASAYKNDNYSENIAVNIIWVKDDGVRSPIVSENITFVRNHLTTIEFEVKEEAKSNSFNITANEEWETGDTITVGNDGIDTEVNPEV